MVRHHALLVAVLVVLAGCALGPGQETGSPAGASISHPVELASTNTYPYRLAVTITHDGETVYAQNLTGDGTASYRQLTTLNESGTYTVQVESNITGKLGGEASANRTVRVDGGERTSVLVNPGNISVVQQPTDPADSQFRVTVEGLETLEGSLTVVVRHDGAEVFRENVTRPQGDDPGALRTLFRHNETGTYQLMVKYSDSFFWTNTTFVVPPVAQSDGGVRAEIHWRFNDFDIEVFGKARQRQGDGSADG